MTSPCLVFSVLFLYYRPQMKFAKVCFHRCLSVHRGAFLPGCCLCPGGSLGVSVGVEGWGSLSVESLSEGSLSGGLSPGVWGSLSRGSLSRGSLSGMVSVQGIFVQGVLCRGEGLCPRELLSRGSLSRGLYQGDPHMVTCGWYTSYLNAFLFAIKTLNVLTCIIKFCFVFMSCTLTWLTVTHSCLVE